MPEYPFANVDSFEHRGERSDQQDGSGIAHPNGTRMVTFDPALSGVLAREVLRLHDAQKEDG